MSGQSSRPDLYAVLGVPPEATQALIDHAYRALVRRYHPDSRGAADAGQASSDDVSLRHVMAAYRVIGNPDRRADYDQRRPNPSPPAGPVRVRVRTGPTSDRSLVTAGPAYWNPWPSTPPTPQRQVPEDSFTRAFRASGLTPQAPSHRPTTSHPATVGMTAETAAAVREASARVEALTAEVHQLRTARDSNRRIGIALGMVMNQRHLNDEQAFDVLRRISQNTNRKLRDVAEDVIQGRHT